MISKAKLIYVRHSTVLQQYQFSEDQGNDRNSSDDGAAALRPPSPRGKRKASNPDIAEGMLLSLKSFR